MGPSELDIAQLRAEMRQLYRHIGFEATLQVLLEMTVASRILAEIIIEERSRDGQAN